jgi:NADPH2:quinone reductase
MPDTMLAARATPGPNGGAFLLGPMAAPRPGKAQIVIQVKASALNRGEIVGLQRLTQGAAAVAPGGLECSGIVVQKGDYVRRWQLGDEVIARTPGCFAEFVCAAEDQAIAKPAGLSWEEAACVPNVYVTANDAIADGAQLKPHEKILVTAGTSGVGVAAIQVARALGTSAVYATTRSADKARMLEKLGAFPIVVDRDAADYRKALQDSGAEALDVVVDLVGGAIVNDLLAALAPRGRFVSVGRSDFSRSPIDLDEVARKNLTILGRSFRTRSERQTIDCITSFERRLGGALAAGQLKPVVDRSFPLARLEEAIAYMCQNGHLGKIAITLE